MTIQPAGNRASIRNAVLRPIAEAVPSLINIIGTYEPLKVVVNEVPALSTSSENSAAVYGFGSMIHRLHLAVELGTDRQVPVYITPQAETAGAKAAGEIDFTGSASVLAGTLFLYIGFDLIRISVTSGMTIENLADATVAAVNADENLNYVAAKTPVTFEVTITSKTTGVFGNDGVIALNLEDDQSTPSGVAAAITQPTGGTGLPDIQDALNGMGTGDNRNSLGFTAVAHGYGDDSTTLEAIRDYVGQGDQLVGTYSKNVARPFYSAVSDTTAGSVGLNALITFGDARTTDRATSVFPVPDSNTHPAEIASQYIGIIEREANLVSARSYTGSTFSRVHPGVDAQRWTNDETNRTTSINAGISNSFVVGNVVTIRDTVTLYHPNSIPESSNIYREISNIRKIRNILNSLKVTFDGPPFPGSFIVQDASRISSPQNRALAIDSNIVRSVIFSLIDSWAAEGWLYEVDFAKANVNIALRSANDGFDSVILAILSGVGKNFDNQVQADISTAILS